MKLIVRAAVLCLVLLFSVNAFCTDVLAFNGELTLPGKYRLDLQHPSFKKDGKTIFSTKWASNVSLPAVYDGVIEITPYERFTNDANGNGAFIKKHEDKIVDEGGFKRLVVYMTGFDYPIVLFYDEKVVIQIIDSDPNVWKEVLKTYKK